MTDVEAGEPATAFAIVAGGTPSAEQVAALTVALSAGASSTPGSGVPTLSAWQEAGLLEGIGFRPFVSVDDVVRYHRSLA